MTDTPGSNNPPLDLLNDDEASLVQAEVERLVGALLEGMKTIRRDGHMHSDGLIWLPPGPRRMRLRVTVLLVDWEDQQGGSGAG